MISCGPRRRRPPGPNARRYHAAPERTARLDFLPWEWKEEKDLMFTDRAEAGRQLLPLVSGVRHGGDVTVVGIPRGGVIVAAEIARALESPLAVWVAQRICAPHRPHLALGTVGEDGDMAFDDETLLKYAVSPGYLVDEVRAQRAEAARRSRLYRPEDETMVLQDRHVVLVDDGAASGGSLKAALRGLKHYRPASITIAIPVAPQRLVRELSDEGETFHTLTRPLSVGDVSQFYRSFPAVSDTEVLAALQQSGLALPDTTESR
jgi:putative phosphoribosyl transferase